MIWGEVAGDSSRERGVRVAGALAELAQTQLLLSQRGVMTPVQARVTDLPGMIEAEIALTDTAVLEAPRLGARFTLSAEMAMWEASTPQVAEMLRANFRS